MIRHAVLALALAVAAPAAPAAVDTEATAKLQALLRVDTTNPPGAEAAAAELIAGWLRAEGLTPTLYETAPGRKAVIARLKGNGRRAPLLLLNHLDVVTANASAWKQGPFSGAIADGALWGRGALDMKGLGIMELMAFLHLHRAKIPLERDVIFCATPDEEDGGDFGVKWLLSHHPEAVAAGEVLNEGGMGLETAGAPLMGIQTAERGVLWVKVTAHGQPGHGSVMAPNGAPRRLVRALDRLEAAKPDLEVIPEVREMLGALADSDSGVRAFGMRAMLQPWLLPLVGPKAVAAEPALAAMLSSTWNTTVLQAGSKVNVMPGSASAEIDIRVLPGHTPEQLLAWLQRTLDDDTLTYEVLHGRAPTVTRERGPLFQALAAASAAEYPGIRTVPVLTPGGGTDSAAFRELGVPSYGCMPIVAPKEQLLGMHGDNEFITLEQITRGTRVVTRAVEAASRVP